MPAGEALDVGPQPLRISARAEPGGVGRLRRAVRDRLVAAGCDDDTVDDLVLATSEALENSVDHAFVLVAEPGTMNVAADLVAGVATIVVRDDGTWRQPRDDHGYRGRGLELIRAAAEQAHVTTAGTGTTVTINRSIHDSVAASRTG